MVQAVVGWRVMTGIHVTTPSFWPEICVEAETDLDPAGENGIARVDFSVAVNGGAPTIVSVTSRGVRFPNYSLARTPLQQRRIGVLAPVERAFGWKLNPSDYDVGTIVITATAYSRAGTATPFPHPITVYNDRDGFDRRPSKKRIHVAITGNDITGTGTEGNPVRELQTALYLAAANPAGTSSADRDAGGSEIVVHPGTYVARQFGSPPTRHTSGDWNINVLCEPGVTFTRSLADGVGGFFAATGNGPGTSFLIRFVGANISGWGITLANNPTVRTHGWLDGCTYSSAHWTREKPWSLLYIPEMALGKALGFEFTGPNARSYVTCSVARGVVNGWSEFQLAHDTVVSDFLALANETNDLGSGGGHICNQLVERQRAMADVAGRVFGFIGGCSVSVPANGQMRIDAKIPLTFDPAVGGAPMNIATLAEIAGNTTFRVRVSGSPVGWHNSPSPPAGAPYGWQVISAGYFGDRGEFQYVVLANPNAVAGTAASVAAGAMKLETVPANSNNPDLYHPDIVYLNNNGGLDHVNGMISGVACRDVDQAQGIFTSETNLVRFCVKNFRDGSARVLNHNMIGGNKTDVYVYGCTFNGNFQFGGAQTGCRGYDNVFGTATGIVGGIWSHNHYLGSIPVGHLNGTSGAWFASNPLASPWFYNPVPSRFDTASGLFPQDPETRWIGSTGTTRGCSRFTGWFDWSVPDDPATSMIGIDVAIPFGIDVAAVAGSVAGIEVFGNPQIDVGAVVGHLAAMDVAIPFAVDVAAEQFSIAAMDVALPIGVDVVADQGNLADIDVALPFGVEVAAEQGSTVDIDVAIPFGVDLAVAIMDVGSPSIVDLDVAIPFGVDLAAEQGNLAGVDVAIPFGVGVDIEQGPLVGLNVAASIGVELGVSASAEVVQNYFPPRVAPGGPSTRRWPLFPPDFWE